MVLFCTLLLNLAGCSGIFSNGTVRKVSEPQQNLTSALNMIRSGLESEARHYLELVIDYSREDGVTDEALFRLAVLKLNDGDLGGGNSSAALLARLRLNYPASVWTKQAAPLQLYLLNVKHIRNREKEINDLHDKNLSLSKDVRGLRQILERMKALDTELEQKIQR